uniref:Putative secreted protein n=1 Tax=Ixodes ricinus TaxID=34613 RepID=A0A147BT71_IXORI
MSLLPTSSVTIAVPLSTMSTMVLQALADSRSVGLMKLPAALFTTMSGRPSSFSQRSTAAATASGFLTSAATGKIFRPVLSLISLAVLSNTSCFLLTMATFAPSCANISVIPLPMPVPPPVIKATLLLKVPAGSMGVVTGGNMLWAEQNPR